MSLYTKYRPQTFEDVLGNSATISALQAVVAKEDRPHSFLLTGPSGCGKTTLGRILAKELGCEGQDYIELNSAEFRGIDSVRDMQRQAQYAPIGPCRVWLLDECHKLTNDAQNALLKLLEEPPSRVYFILCTTNPQNLIATIKSRCSTFSVAPLDEGAMLRLLRRAVKGEGGSLEKPIYELIAQESLGHPRAALTILEQVLAVGPDERKEIARKAAAEAAQTIELCRALIARNSWKKVRGILAGLNEEEPEQIRQAVLGYCKSVLLSNDSNNQAAAIMEAFIDPFYDAAWPKLVYACYSLCADG